MNIKIAVTYNNEEVYQHFGHTAQFKIYELEEVMVCGDRIEGGRILNSVIVDTNGSGHGALAQFLKDQNVDFVICGGIGGGAKDALAEKGIKLFGGVSGNCDACVEELMNGTLNYNPNIQCSHHDHGENHKCGEHGCGSHEEQKDISSMKFSSR